MSCVGFSGGFVFFFEELFTLHPACLWARETLGLGLKLWTNRHETFSTACIISVVETYLCHNQLVKRQYCLDWLPRGFPEWESWELKRLHFFFHKDGSNPHISAYGDPVLWVSAQWGQAMEQERNSPLQTADFEWDLWLYSCSSTVCLFKAVVGYPRWMFFCFFPAKYYGMDCFLQFLTPKAANEAVCVLVYEVINCKQRKYF